MAHRQVLEGSELPNLTRQLGELVVVELAQKSVLTRRGEAAAHPKQLERSEATDLRRNRDQAVLAQLQSNASATSESASATHVQERQLRHDQHARGDLGEGVVPELEERASKQRHENNREAHVERGHVRQLRDGFTVAVDVRCQNTNHRLLLDKHSAELAGCRAEIAKDGRKLLLGVLLTDVGGCEGSLTTAL